MSTGSERKAARPSDLAKRQAIIEAAARSFFAIGYAATSIEQVAADAGVSKVTIYAHFTDKRGLFTAAVERECEKIRGAFSLEGMGNGDLRERLTAIGQAMMVFLSRGEMVQFDRRIAAETEHDPEIGRAFLAAGPRQMKSAFTRLLEAMDAAGELTIADHDLAAEQFVSMCRGMGDLERRFGAPPDPVRDRQRVAGAVEVFLRAYRR